MDNTIATTILEQLGGRRFMVMTGIRKFHTNNGDDLCMKIGRNKSKANHLRIEYDYNEDLYIMRFLRITKSQKITEVRTFEGVYCDQLEELFREITGLETRMLRIHE